MKALVLVWLMSVLTAVTVFADDSVEKTVFEGRKQGWTCFSGDKAIGSVQYANSSPKMKVIRITPQTSGSVVYEIYAEDKFAASCEFVKLGY